MDFTDVEQAPYTTPQTATVSDEAVQAALDRCEKVDWVQGLFGTGLSGREIIESALAAAIPHLALSASPCSVEAKKLTWRAYGNQHMSGWQGMGGMGYLHYISDTGPDGEGKAGWFSVLGQFDTADQAKAEAQADFDRRILSQIVTKPVELLDENSFQANISEIGNQIHNLSCEYQNDEALSNRLQELRDQLWGMAKDAAEPVDVAAVREQALDEAAQVANHFADHSAIEGMSEEIVMAQSYIAYDIATAIRAFSTAEPVLGEPDFSKSIAEVIKEESLGGAACGWKSCTGCLETNEGYPCGEYPYSEVFKTHAGSGCIECGGIGVVWEYYSKSDLDEMQRDQISAEPVDQWQDIATAPKGVSVLLLRDNGSILIEDWQRFYQSNHPNFTHWMPLPVAPTSKGGE